MANKKRKLSGLGVLELSQAYNSLLNLKSSFLYEEVDIDAQVDKEAESNELFVIQLENVI
ncbi:hypothetical protein VKT23_002453 [Stygiomarasmius scandens]|uniref:Uncharacterized protein n=1 Tax=Marasmiellus scandens TaxID=2682957 RepID=A0ABR1K2H3_9AGAR